MTPDWALFRGDKVIPFVTARMKKNTVAVTHLGFVLPSGWNNVDTGWPRLPNNRFVIDNPERSFDRPIGWIIAGKVGTRYDKPGMTEVDISRFSRRSMSRSWMRSSPLTRLSASPLAPARPVRPMRWM